MKKLNLFLLLPIFIGLFYVTNTSISLGKTTLPPLGKFFNPFSGFWQNAEDADNKIDLALDNTAGIEQSVSIYYDDRLVPHIFAKSYKDALFAQGYVTATNRLWQMDFITRATGGRMSEILGKQAVDFDKQKRRQGLSKAAKAKVETWKKSKDFELLEAYIEGVNLYISQLDYKDYPLEFKLLDYKPEKWNAEKTALLIMTMADDLAGYEEDLEATNTLKLIGDRDFNLLFPNYYKNQAPIIPKSHAWDFEAVTINNPSEHKELSDDFSFKRVLDRPSPNLGSNNWAVAGTKTSSGNPILAGDPHLGLRLPSIWYEIHINTPDNNIYGVSLPGMTGIIIGFNDDIAWSMTNSGWDVKDWYKVQWVDETKEAYLYDGNERKTIKEIEEIKVKNAPTEYETVLYTHHGPIVSQDKDDAKKDLALKYSILEASEANEISIFKEINTASNHTEFLVALNEFDVPAQNFVFASIDGDIGIRTQGKFPLKSENQGKFILDGSTSNDEWHGFIPKEHNPSILNPELGYVSSANQHPTDVTYPYFYNGNFPFYRGKIINQSLEANNRISTDDMKSLQTSSFSLQAKASLPVMIRLLDKNALDTEETELLNDLKKWDYHFEGNSTEAVVYEIWYETLKKMTWDEFISEEEELLVPRDWRFIDIINNDVHNKYFDIVETESKTEKLEDILILSFKETYKEYKKLDNEITWSKYRDIQIGHMARIDDFSVSAPSVGGHKNSLNALKETTTSTAGPSWRMIVELDKNGHKAWGAYPGGQSGNPGSKYYSSFMSNWENSQYYELLFNPNIEFYQENYSNSVNLLP